MDPRELLLQEFGRRRERNRRYSLRAFARDLATDHSALSQLLRGRRSCSPRMVRRFGARLGWSEAMMGQACVLQAADAVLRMVRSGRYRPDCRHIAARTGVPLDGVNAALHHLLRTGSLQMISATEWRTNTLTHGQPRRTLADRVARP